MDHDVLVPVRDISVSTSADLRGTSVAVTVRPAYARPMPRPEGFDYVVRGEDVVITHHGRRATALRGARPQAFLEDVRLGDPQELMARATGNYRRGNERQSRSHPRNQGR